MKKTKGFTLVEMMVTVAVLAIVLGMAVPDLTAMVQSYKITTAASSLASGMALARSEAIKRGVNVTMCPSSDGSNCATSGDWAQGWVMFAVAGQAIRSSGEIGSGFTAIGSLGVASGVTYLPSGATSLAATGTITICKSGRGSKVLEIVPSGRVRVSQGAVCA